jgi:hypothetical protein
MSRRWGPGEQPPDEAYERVTEPERFAAVVDAADALVERLIATYDVTVSAVELERATRAVRLQPAQGAPLAIGVTDFPGVVLRFGHWCSTHQPMCGCDACDETPDEAIEEMTDVVGAVVTGRFTEELAKKPLSLSRWLDGGRDWSALDETRFRQLAEVAPPGRHDWPAWPLRAPAG